MYWKTELRVIFWYKKVNKLQSATHILVEGKQGNKDLVSLEVLKT